MQDIASQLVLKWARKGPDYRIPVTDDFTRLTLDTIALCSMDYRFNSFYQDKMHPFVDAMMGMLAEAGNRARRPALVTKMMTSTNAKYLEDSQTQQRIAAEVVQSRRENPTAKRDLLNAMMAGKDPKTGEGLRDELIMANMVTFLIAGMLDAVRLKVKANSTKGHETTSGLLSFAFLFLLQHPSAYQSAQNEIDQVVGKGPVRVQHLKQMKYVNAVLRETLRLSPTVPAISKKVNPKRANDINTLGRGKHLIEPQTKIICLFSKAMKDGNVYGEDACEFKPERMLDEGFSTLPSAAWKVRSRKMSLGPWLTVEQPFGNGVRACIGRAFAWQEALMVTATLLQNFDFHLDDPTYQMRIKQNLTIKPKDFYMKATLREGIDATTLERSMYAGQEPNKAPKSSHDSRSSASHSREMLILYGSNTGTAQALAQKLVSEALSRGFAPHLSEMDAATGNVANRGLVILITSSYEGQPPDNAARFIEWMRSLQDSGLKEARFAVFGLGHSK